MKKIFILLSAFILLSQPSYANWFKDNLCPNDDKQIKTLLKSQVKYANKNNFDKFISTYDENYINSDGFNLETYSKLVKDIWSSYNKIVYGLKIKNINIIDQNNAVVEVTETSFAPISATQEVNGLLKSESESIYYLKKLNGKWKVSSDKVITENTSMLYGEAMNLDIKLTAPKEIEANTEYTASLEFTPPKDTIAIASISSDKVEYPQKPTKEVFRKLPDDNILERLFTANNENCNEYIIASIGLTKADIKDLSIKLSLTGFGYQIIRVNVIPEKAENNEGNNVQK